MYEAVEEVRYSSIISFAVNGCPSSSAIMPSEIVRKKPPLYLARDSAVRVMPGNQGLIPRRRKAFYLSLLSLFTFTEENIKIWVYTNEDSLLALSRSSTSLEKKKERKELNRCIEIFVDEMEDGCENESTRNERESLRFSDYDCKWRANCTESPRWTPDPY